MQRWVARAGEQRLDRVDWSDRPCGLPTPINRTARHLQDLVLTIRQQLRDTSDLGEFGAAAAQIVVGGGDYVLAVKDHQATLPAEVREAFESALENEVAPLRRHGSDEKGHGRRERRVVWVVPTAQYLSCQAAWLGLLTLVMVLRVATCPVSGAETLETRYFISSLRPSARRLARVICGHWMIENGLHWVLDVVFREDARRWYDRTAAEHVGLRHRVAASLLRGDTSKGL